MTAPSDQGPRPTRSSKPVRATPSRRSRTGGSRPDATSAVAVEAPAESAAVKPTSRGAVDVESPLVRACTCARVRRLARRVTQLYDQVLAPSGVRVTQFSLLSAIRAASATPIGSLAAALDMDRTTLTRNLKPLVDAGWVSLSRATGDGRLREARLTEAGHARHDEAKQLWRVAQRRIERTLGETRTDALHRLFDEVGATLGEHGQPLPELRPDDGRGRHRKGETA